MPGSDQALAELASLQFGLFTARQAHDLGLTESAQRHRVTAGRWSTVHPSVFAIAGSPDSAHRRLLAACLLGGPGTLAGRLAAAWLWDLPGAGQPTVAVLSPRWSRVRRAGIEAHESISIGADDLATRAAIPVTSATRTIIDCCASVSDRVAGAMLDDGRRRGLLTLDSFRSRVDELAASGRNGIVRARSLCEARTAPTASVLEHDLLVVLTKAGLPAPTVGHAVVCGGARYVLDFAYVEQRVCIEVDSERFHLDLEAFHGDRRRQNALVLAGWTLLRFTWRDRRHRPQHVVAEVARALRQAAA